MSSVKPPFLTWLDIDIGFVNPYTFVGVKQSLDYALRVVGGGISDAGSNMVKA